MSASVPVPTASTAIAASETKKDDTAAAAGCCPPGAPGRVEPGPWTNKGSDVKLGDLPAYITGDRGDIGIIVFQEIFGIDSGRLKQNCDLLAAAGFVVVIADYHRGVNASAFVGDFAKVGKWLAGTPWTKIHDDITTHLVPLLRSRGVTKFGALGFCWGSWAVLKLSATGLLSAGAYCHPSHPRIVLAYREVADDVVKAAKSPILCYAAGDDGEGVKAGGNDEKLLAAVPASVNGTKNEFKAFPDVKHGWVTRLPLEQPEICRDYNLAIQGVIAFFKRTIV